MQLIGRGCINDGVRTIIIIMTIKNKCPVDFSPQIRSMNVFFHKKKEDIGVLPRADGVNSELTKTLTYKNPGNIKRLYLVVVGCPTKEYRPESFGWGRPSSGPSIYPYQIKF